MVVGQKQVIHPKIYIKVHALHVWLVINLLQFLQFTVRIFKSSREQLHTRISYFIPRQIQFFQVFRVWSQSWSQSSTTLICDTTTPQPANNDTLFTLSDQIIMYLLLKRKYQLKGYVSDLKNTCLVLKGFKLKALTAKFTIKKSLHERSVLLHIFSSHRFKMYWHLSYHSFSFKGFDCCAFICFHQHWCCNELCLPIRNNNISLRPVFLNHNLENAYWSIKITLTTG